MIEKEEVEVLKTHTLNNAVDMMTKPLPKLKFQKRFELMGFDLLVKGRKNVRFRS